MGMGGSSGMGGGGGFLSGLMSGGKQAASAIGSAAQPALRFGANLFQNPSGGNFLQSMLSALTGPSQAFDPQQFLQQFLDSQNGLGNVEPPGLPQGPDYLQQLLRSLGQQPRSPNMSPGSGFALGPQHSLRIGELIMAAAAA